MYSSIVKSPSLQASPKQWKWVFNSLIFFLITTKSFHFANTKKQVILLTLYWLQPFSSTNHI